MDIASHEGQLIMFLISGCRNVDQAGVRRGFLCVEKGFVVVAQGSVGVAPGSVTAVTGSVMARAAGL